MADLDDKQRAAEHAARSRLFDKGHGIGMAFCALWPIALYFLAPSVLENALIGSAVLIVSIAQFLWVPDQIGAWMAKRN